MARAEDRRACAGIAGCLRGTGFHGFRDRLPAPLFAHRLRQVARLGGATLVGIEEAFDDAVFERVESNDGEAPTFEQQTLAREQAFDQLPELIVYSDAQRLE